MGGRERRGGRMKGSGGDGWGLRVTVQRERWKREEMNAGKERMWKGEPRERKEHGLSEPLTKYYH